MKLTLKSIAENIVGKDEADTYLKFELPKEDPSREFELIASDDEVEIYRDCDVYLLHCSTGLETGMWDDLATDYPLVAPLLRSIAGQTRPVKVDAAGTIEQLDDAGVLAKATEHGAACGRAWIVNPSSDSTGMPLDWSGERSVSELANKGFIVIPKPGETIDDLKASRMLRD